MRFFSSCKDDCCVCFSWEHGCLAGHGDDDFSKASKEALLKRYNDMADTSQYVESRQVIKKRLQDWYNVDTNGNGINNVVT